MESGLTKKPHKLANFFREVWRRHVLQVAIPYCVGGWLLIQVAELVLEAFEFPSWVLQAILIAFLVGLPIVIVLAWIFDITAAGLVRTRPIDDEQAEPTEAVPAPAMGLSLGKSERRQVTMLSCSFNFRAGQENEEDPEFLREAILALESVFKEVTTRFRGYRLRSSSEKLTLVFGYPGAQDDDARRAVAAGLALLESARKLDENHDGIPDLSVQVGIHTGMVVIDESQKDQAGITIIGQVPRFVAWLESMAPADCVTISTQTRELVHRFHAVESLGLFKLTQSSEPVEIFRARSDSEHAGSAEVLQPIGRELELTQLQARWQHASDGEGQFVLVRGVPGIGKSSLVRAFVQGVSESSPAQVLQVYCSPYEPNTSLHPIIQALRGPMLGFEANDGRDTRWQKLSTLVQEYCQDYKLALPLLARLLSIALPDDIAPLSGSPQQIRTQTLELLIHLIRHQGESRPVLLVLEDLHWADPTTLDWVQMLVEEGPSQGVFLLLTARPDFSAEWTRRSWVLAMDLLPLANRAATELLRQTAGEVVLPPALVEYIVRETGGNPLYVHELTRAVLESGDWQQVPAGAEDPDLSWMKIPATLKESLAARVDHLGPAKALLQLCSVLGREFDYEQLRAVSGTENEVALKNELNSIVQAELLFRRGSSANPSYTFKHILIQETAYNSLLRSKRKELHLRTARIIEKDYPEIAQTQPELLAWHFGEADESAIAVTYWARAARLSLQAFSNLEAISHARSGLELVQTLPPTAERIAQEIPLQSMLGSGLLATRGYAAPEVREAFTRARYLCEQAGDAPQLFQVLVGLWMYNQISANYQQALELSQTLVRIADVSAEPGKYLQARYCLGYTLYYQADYQAARQVLELALQSEQQGIDYRAQSASGDDTRTHVRIVLAHLYWHLGYTRKALSFMDDALRLAREEDNPFGIAFVTFNAAWFHTMRQDADTALPLARAAVEMATANGYSFFKPLAEFMQAWAEGREPKPGLLPADEQTVRQQQAIAGRHQQTGALLGKSFQYFSIAADLVALGHNEEAEQILMQAWQHVEQTGERFMAPEFHRLLGRVRLRQGQIETALVCFHTAREMARRSGSAALEHRTTLDLADALASAGQADKALQLLQDSLSRIAEPEDSEETRLSRQLLKKLQKQLK